MAVRTCRLRRGLGLLAAAILLGVGGAAAPEPGAPKRATATTASGFSRAFYFGRPRSARFRVTARGFRVDRQSYDNIVESDGRGDEVFVRADVFEFNWRPEVIATSSIRTDVLGERGPLHGGSRPASPLDADGRPGGFVTGDSYPHPFSPWQARPPSVHPNDLPMRLWEGELFQGTNAVVIVPTLWEWDGPDLSPEQLSWDRSLPPAIRRVAPAIERIIVDRPATTLFDNMFTVPVFNRGTRPIGSSGNFALPTDIDSFVLTYDSAVELARGRGSEVIVRDAGGGLASRVELTLPEGVFWIRLVDPPGLDGAYTLYLFIERLP
ncbi:MAG TPA: hypothetical protein VF574_00125 [Allosphingosinicella sp.]|jgi:hypothetical protein